MTVSKELIDSLKLELVNYCGYGVMKHSADDIVRQYFDLTELDSVLVNRLEMLREPISGLEEYSKSIDSAIEKLNDVEPELLLDDAIVSLLDLKQEIDTIINDFKQVFDWNDTEQ